MEQKEVASMGGKARWKGTTKAQRSEAARQAGIASGIARRKKKKRRNRP